VILPRALCSWSQLVIFIKVNTVEDTNLPTQPVRATRELASLASDAMPSVGSASSHLLLQASLVADASPEILNSPEGEALVRNASDMIAGVRTGGGIEDLLGAQAVAFSSAALTLLNKAVTAASTEQRDRDASIAVKLAKTSAGLLSTLSQWKLGASKNLMIGNVNIESGSQAVVGNLTVLPRHTAEG
jgi:hypothetical protein